MTNQTSIISVFGHKNPDTDAIISAIVFQDWLAQQNISAQAYRLGEINQETKFLLNFAQINEPELLTILPKDSNIALLDHNERVQSIENLSDYRICYVIDHHKLGDLTTKEPTYIRIQPVGSTSTLLYLMYQEQNLTISPTLAKLMVGAILSDTLNLTSPTTTPTEHQILPNLLQLANIDNQQDFAEQLFNAKSDINHLTDMELITADYKQFQFSNKNWGIAVIETVNPQPVFNRLDSLQSTINQVKMNDNLDYLLVIVVDIFQQQSWAIATNNEQDAMIETAFTTKQAEKLLPLGNLVSRKKQFVPTLETYYQHL